ncbi:hypothetical protein LC55x_5180 [Lysobacter capsici]|uniref:Uncharacterized protein n=1 Tax=Lysobacter capsici AZ78 TaxID=1444315 RepID=A0A125MN92_9GAMM|nr:hypothetical protein LC55x_5180 [Lysobacter capsici]KWS05826.1 hypothetical protein AZ78_3379 [Lysobacter capsici AZ78]
MCAANRGKSPAGKARGYTNPLCCTAMRPWPRATHRPQ